MGMKRLFVALFAIFSIASALAYDTGNDLLADLKSSNQERRVRAGKYVGGVVHGWDVSEIMNKKQSNLFCLPDAVTQGQVADLVAKYLEEYPERRHRPAYEHVIVALIVAFRCDTK
jgi:hypothetical protein